MNNRPRKKVKMTAGRVHKTRCGVKKFGGKCECGQYGKDIIHYPVLWNQSLVSSPWGDKMTHKIEKERKRYAWSRWLEKVKGVYEGVA
jgi:hypothetical protein